jgi:hypothetical protein
MVDLEKAISMEGAEGSTYCKEMNFSRKWEPEKQHRRYSLL